MDGINYKDNKEKIDIISHNFCDILERKRKIKQKIIKIKKGIK